MAETSALLCPLCDCEVMLDGDEKIGDQIYCAYCEAPLKLAKTKDDRLYLVEDF
ncbi:MAG: hypothetical protein HY883_00970 [Deltaproteobacteria bacterium]|nr:hypothetical protein [Deltaproteobacteria bacterium]